MPLRDYSSLLGLHCYILGNRYKVTEFKYSVTIQTSKTYLHRNHQHGTDNGGEYLDYEHNSRYLNLWSRTIPYNSELMI